jgi:hypothetical protein
MAQAFDRAVVAQESQEAERHVAEDRHDLGCIAGVDAAGILAEDDIAHPMQAVFDAPIAAHEGRQPFGIGLSRRQAGDAEDYLDAAHAGALIDTLPLEAKDLLQAGPTAILGGQGVGSLQGAHFNAAAVQVRPSGRRERLRDDLGISEQGGDVVTQGGLVVLGGQDIVTTFWFSYKTADFISETREIYRAIRITRALFPGTPLRFVGDSGLDDQKIFAQVARVASQFIFRVKHEDRLVEVYNERLQRWEGPEHLNELAASVPWTLRLQVAFHHAHKTRRVTVSLGWLPLRLPDTQQRLWALVACDPDYERQIILLTNVPLTTPEIAEQVYTQWRCRPRIEHTYRFDQEQGLDVEEMRVQTVERMRRVFALMLLAALFVYHIDQTWPQQAVCWLRRLGGKLGLGTDADGPYILLAGISAVLVALATIRYAHHHPFPRPRETYG